MIYPKAYIDYLVYFHGPRDYFECHEELEEHWKQDKRGERKIHWVGLIQIAVGLYHQRLGNFRGAERMIKKALSILKNERKPIEDLGLHFEELISLLQNRYIAIKNNTPYKSLNLPISDVNLLATCKEKCKDYNCEWGDPSNLSDEFLIRKHSLRDRSNVIIERNKQIAKKKGL